jgi:phosphatidylglycerophosphate synthase
MIFLKGRLSSKRSERSSLTRFMPAEISDYPIKSKRYIAFEKAAVALLCKQDFIEPNHITYFRFFICLLLILFSSRLTFLQIFILALVGAISDFFDGALARSASKKTRLGIILDPLADKLFAFVLVSILVLRGAMNPTYLGLMIVMEGHMVLIPAFSWLYGVRNGGNGTLSSLHPAKERGVSALRIQALFIGKVKFFFYASAILGILLGEMLHSDFILNFANWLLVLGIAAGAIAFVTYLNQWFKRPYSIA